MSPHPSLPSPAGHNFHLNNSATYIPLQIAKLGTLQRPGEPRGWPVACFAEGSPPAPGHKELNVFKAGFRSNQSGLAQTWDKQRMGGGGELVISISSLHISPFRKKIGEILIVPTTTKKVNLKPLLHPLCLFFLNYLIRSMTFETIN